MSANSLPLLPQLIGVPTGDVHGIVQIAPVDVIVPEVDVEPLKMVNTASPAPTPTTRGVAELAEEKDVFESKVGPPTVRH